MEGGEDKVLGKENKEKGMKEEKENEMRGMDGERRMMLMKGRDKKKSIHTGRKERERQVRGAKAVEMKWR